MQTPVLSDPDVFPSDKVLARSLKRANPAFLSLLEFNHKRFPRLEERWKYYRDGKSWLMNVSMKKKTLFWLSVGDGFFRVTFYMNREARQLVMKSALGVALKKHVAANIGKQLVGLTLEVKTKKDIEPYEELMRIKLASL
jgi:hypothetical protein